MLTTATISEFDAGDRRRGNEMDAISTVELVDAGISGVRALVDGSSDRRYLVVLDFEYMEDFELGVFCDCRRFEDGYACKHLWATMSKFDLLFDSPLGNTTTLELVVADPAELVVGKPLTRAISSIAAGGTRQPNRNQAKQKTPKPSGAQWLAQLGQITQAKVSADSLRSFGLPSDVLPDSVHQLQHWFVLSISEPANANGFQVISMRSTRKNDGHWGRPVATEQTPADISAISNESERHAYGLLQPQREYGANQRYGYNRAGHRLFSINSKLLPETIQAMYRSGRLAWKLGDSKQHFEDARPVDELSIEQLSNVHFSIAPDSQKQTGLVVTPQVTVPDGSAIPIEQLVWLSGIGCALVEIPAAEVRKPQAPEAEDSTATLAGAAADGAAADGAAADGAAEFNQYDNLDPHNDQPIRTRLIRLSAHHCTILQAWRATKSLRVPRRSMRSLLRELSASYGHIDMKIDASLKQIETTDDPSATCLLQQSESRATEFVVTMRASYPNRELAFDSAIKWWFDDHSQTIHHRNWESERHWLSTINSSEFEFTVNGYRSEMRLPPDRFVRVVETLRKSGWDVTANGAPIRIASNFDIHVSSGVDWFDLDAEVAFDEVNAKLPELLDAIKQGQQTIALDDGTVGMLPTEWLAKFVGIRESGQMVDGSVRFHRSQGLLLDLMLEELPDVCRDRDYSKFLRQLKSFDGIKPAEPTKSFSGELRNYQRDGLGWFRFLQQFGFGGCLADDMGLGKTIQVLALLDARRKRRLPKGETRKPSIVVAPKSLIFNWLAEAAKFTPKLRVHNHTGTERKEDWDQLAESPNSIDVLLTTYGTMRIDAPLLARLEFDYAILDEAQAIKNPKSLVARASRLIRAEHRLAMTGTPVENHLGDLWSLFDFLNPGMLSNAKFSSSNLPDLEDEIQRRQVEKIGKSLRPFILRRTKSEVLAELPEKTEQTLSCVMDTKQQKLYDDLREHYRIHLSNKVKELGLKKAKIHVLEALLRLRQAACDPRLINPDCGVRGVKINDLLERLEELRQEGRKALVFSQFTSLLSLLRQDLDERDWNYEYLDGKTRKRGEKVLRFQTDPNCQLFLISLKAGGNGLNLTAAEYVFILDPWWNPAVEAQAIDRAHRIGQTQSVNAYRMICRETVEAKIIELQKSKRDLADAIISQNKSVIGQLTANDLQDLLG